MLIKLDVRKKFKPSTTNADARSVVVRDHTTTAMQFYAQLAYLDAAFFRPMSRYLSTQAAELK